MRLGPDNAAELIAGYDLVADGSDNFATRYLLTDLCFRLEKPLIAAALSPFEGQLSTFRPYLGAGAPVLPLPVPRAAAARTWCRAARRPAFSARSPASWARLQAVEVLKELLGLGDSLDGTLLIYDALQVRFHRIRIAKDPDCPTCGQPAGASKP